MEEDYKSLAAVQQFKSTLSLVFSICLSGNKHDILG